MREYNIYLFPDLLFANPGLTTRQPGNLFRRTFRRIRQWAPLLNDSGLVKAARNLYDLCYESGYPVFYLHKNGAMHQEYDCLYKVLDLIVNQLSKYPDVSFFEGLTVDEPSQRSAQWAGRYSPLAIGEWEVP